MTRSRSIALTRRSERLEHGNADRTVRAAHLLTFLCSCFLAAVLIAGGCAGGPSHKEQYFILEAVREDNPARPASDGSLQVHRFSIDTAFATKNLVYRLGEFKYEEDYYRQFLISPGTMITEKTRVWLADSGLFNTVLPVGSRIVPTYTLEGNITALYGDFLDESAPTAVMEIRFFLVKIAEGQESVVFARTYRAASAVPSRTTDAFVNALNQSLVEILTCLEADLQKIFVGKPIPPGNT